MIVTSTGGISDFVIRTDNITVGEGKKGDIHNVNFESVTAYAANLECKLTLVAASYVAR